MRWRSLPSQGLKKLIAARCPQGLSSRVPFLRAVVDHQDSLSLDDVVAFMANQGIVALPQAGRPSASASSVEIKCLLFLNAGAPLLIILPVQDRVSEPALAAFLGVPKSRLSMAPVNALVSLCGFPVGAVPPFGHRTPLPTIVDDTVVAHSHVVFGPSNEFVVACAELLRVSQATVGPISVASTSAASNGTHSTEAVICAEWDSPQMPIPWKPGAQAVKMGGVIVQKRNIAKLLLFANIIPPLTQALPRVRSAHACRYSPASITKS